MIRERGGDFLTKTKHREGGQLRAEYDFGSMPGGVRGKYASESQPGVRVVILKPDVAAAFPSADAVNGALRAVMRASTFVRRGRRYSR